MSDRRDLLERLRSLVPPPSFDEMLDRRDRKARRARRSAGAVGLVLAALVVGGVLVAVGDTRHGITPSGGGSGTAATMIDGTIAFTVDESDGWHLGTVNPDGSDRVVLTHGVRDYGTAWSPDGTQIAYDTDQTGIWIMNADGTGPRQLTSGSDMFPKWSPDGTQIAFSRFGKGMYQGDKFSSYPTSYLWVVNADGTGEHQLTSGEVADTAGSWSPDGSKITFVRASADGTGVWMINADGTGGTKLVSLKDQIEGNPSWSPDGTKILYTRMGFISGNSAPRIWVVNADGTNDHMVLDEWAENPTWSPDGTKIAYSNGDIWVMDANGTNTQRVTHDPNEEIQPSWGLNSGASPAPSP